MATDALARGLEILPRRVVEHDGRAVAELDVDGLLERCPHVALVDALAHDNAPGSRPRKRHQDVEELLDAGIDVLSTLGIQHVESLNDVVASITRVRVRETVPDIVLDAAEIELADIPADELIERFDADEIRPPLEAIRAGDVRIDLPNR